MVMLIYDTVKHKDHWRISVAVFVGDITEMITDGIKMKPCFTEIGRAFFVLFCCYSTDSIASATEKDYAECGRLATKVYQQCTLLYQANHKLDAELTVSLNRQKHSTLAQQDRLCKEKSAESLTSCHKKVRKKYQVDERRNDAKRNIKRNEKPNASESVKAHKEQHN